MSLEEALNRNTEALNRNGDLMEQLLGAAKTAQGNKASGDGETAPKKTKKSDKADKAEKAVTLDDIKPKLSAWLNEFPKEGENDHVETVARKGEFKKILEKVKAENLMKVPADKLGEVDAWFEDIKEKGRLTEDEEKSSDDDDMLG